LWTGSKRFHASLRGAIVARHEALVMVSKQ
jgi:hypothetical protein